MKRALGFLLSTFCLPACLTSHMLIKVGPDGRGTVEYSTTIRAESVAEFQKLVAPELAANPARSMADMVDPRKTAAARLGWDVRLRSAEPRITETGEGWSLTYEFDDVSALGIDLLPPIGVYRVAARDGTAPTQLKMSLETVPDGLERLRVRFPSFALDPATEAPASWASGSPAEMAALRGVLKGSRITIAVETKAPLIRTNSPFRDGNRVTLLDADIEQALFSKQIAMLATTPATFEEMLDRFADLPGVTLAHEREITLDFQNPSLTPPAASQTAQPVGNPEVFLAPLSIDGGNLAVGPPINISRNPGYDNQPSFTPDGSSILFASDRGPSSPARPAAGPAGARVPTDIYRYEIRSRELHRVTHTPESEYSPTVMPDGRRISVVRVEADGTQRLWSVTDAGSASASKEGSALILADVKPVGYHAWIDDRTVALFVLGARGRPATLQVADVVTGRSEVVATGIGRSIQKIPSGGVSFVQQRPVAGAAAPAATIERLIRGTSAQPAWTAASLIQPAGESSDPFLAWMPDGTLLMAVNSTLYRWHAGDRDWTVVANLEAFGLRGISRLAVSPLGDRLALVAQAR